MLGFRVAIRSGTNNINSAENLVLTAAHCCDGMRKGTLVKAGYIKKDEWDNRQTRKMKQYMIHSDYDDFTGTYCSLGFTGRRFILSSSGYTLLPGFCFEHNFSGMGRVLDSS